MAGESVNVDQWRTRIYRYRLLGGRCRECGRAFYPPLPKCPYCSSEDVEEVRLPRQGKLVSYTILYSVEEGARRESPVIVGLVDLGVARVVSEIVDAEPGTLKSGMAVEAVFRRLYEEGDEGVIVYGVKFRPAPENTS
ncbi:MAG: Zn-ribbon domain-containing OB-fold protein [Desulfurococcales archaeon]|nr:Zn-ribbon domain-containing OB-fold protein [Desulfurococcales archaeon]